MTVLSTVHLSVSDFASNETRHLDAGGGRLFAGKLDNLVSGLAAGRYRGSAKVYHDAVKASGTFTLDTVIATDAVSINGVTLTCVASGAVNNEFNVGADDEETAVNLAAAINASTTALVNKHVVASASELVVTVTAVDAGHAGNAVTIASADATITASGARLENGTNGTSPASFTF